MRIQITNAARGIDIMCCTAIQTGVHHSDVEGPRQRRRITRQQAFRHSTFSKRDAVNGDAMATHFKPFGSWLGAEDMAKRRRFKLLADLGCSVVISAQDKGANAGLRQSDQFLLQKTRSLCRGLRPVPQVTCNQQSIYTFGQAQINDARQSRATGNTDLGCKVGVAQSQGDQRRVQMQISGVNKSECHLS